MLDDPSPFAPVADLEEYIENCETILKREDLEDRQYVIARRAEARRYLKDAKAFENG
jgi:hypothetical protein